MSILIVRCGEWPEPATILGSAEDWETAGLAREFIDATGCQPVMAGYVAAGEVKSGSDKRGVA